MASDGEISCTNDPNFAVIYSFLKVFGKLYGLEIPTIVKLQELVENTQEVLEPLKDLHLRLLRRALKSVQSNRWERCLIKFCHQQGHHQEAWEIERFSYKKASTQVKLKILKVLLEYQFTCHAKFKSAVNALCRKELRLEPVGRDLAGRAYWLQTDHDANLCLYREDQDEETWQLIASNREELVKVISQLKNGEEISPSAVANNNEDSNSADVPSKLEPSTTLADEENDEEFLSPESESELDEDPTISTKSLKDEESECRDDKKDDTLGQQSLGSPKQDLNTEHCTDTEERQSLTGSDYKEETVHKDNFPKIGPEDKDKPENLGVDKVELKIINEENPPSPEIKSSSNCESIQENALATADIQVIKPENDNLAIPEDGTVKSSEVEDEEKGEICKTICNASEAIKKVDEAAEKVDEQIKKDDDVVEKVDEAIEKVDEAVENVNKIVEDVNKAKGEVSDAIEEVSEAIEEPVMLITGEGSGADCDSCYIIGEEITEPIMFFYGEGCGFDNDTGNPEAISREEELENETEENGNNELVNGDNHELPITKTKFNKSIKLRNRMPSVKKRTLKKQSTDASEVLKPDTKKPCVRNNDLSDGSNSKSVERDLIREGSINEKTTTDTDSPVKNNVKKGRNKVKKKINITNKLKIKEAKEVLNSVTEADSCHDSKTSIIEKRKSSLSSEDAADDTEGANEREKSPNKEIKVEDALPPKKIRLETTPESDNVSHSKETVEKDVNNSNCKNTGVIESNSTVKRKKIKARKGKFKRKKVQSKVNDTNKSIEADCASHDKEDEVERVKNKSLKRSLLDTTTTLSDRNKSESQSESDEDEPVLSGKRLKIKPKKIVKSSRKKVEEKLKEKHSSDESEEETLYSLGKKINKKPVKRKVKKDGKVKGQDKGKESEGSGEETPVRQSRRIAQLKIREEAQRRHLEDVALRELKKIHNKKNKDSEEDWQASDRCSSTASERRARRHRAPEWHAADSTGPDQDTDTDEPIFEHVEPDLVFTKSDHEFSPESDLESGEPEPLKRARTLQEESDEGFCKRCGSGEQPEWILLCDRCDSGYHASCLKPVLFLVPDSDWFCPPCNHAMLIESLEKELTKYDELLVVVQAEREKRKLEEPKKGTDSDPEKDKDDKSGSGSEGSSGSWSSESADDGGAVYRLRARRQLPVSLRAQEYDRLISSAIKEEYVEPTTSAGNQGRGKDISTIIEAAEEEKLKAEREAIEQGKPVEKKSKKKQRKKPRKLNSLEVPSEDDDETDEDFKDTGMESSSEEISSSAERESSAGSQSSDDLPIRRVCRPDHKDRPKLAESPPEFKKKKKGVFEDTTSESGDNKDWSKKSKKSKSKRPKHKRRSGGKSRRGLTQYDADGNVIRARVTYGGLTDGEDNDWSPKHRTRQKKINYTEMPNTESEDEMHKSSGKHMPDSSDEFKIDDSDLTTDSDSDRAKRKRAEESERSLEEKRKALDELIKKTAVVPLEKLPDDVTKAKTEELQAHLDAQSAAMAARPQRGRGSRGGRGGGNRGGRRGGGKGRGGDDAMSAFVGLKIKEFKPEGGPGRPTDAEREKKRQEREAKQAEKEARKQERLQKKEEKEKLKEQKAKEREEKRLARLAMQENKRLKKEKVEVGMPISGYNVPIRGGDPRMPLEFHNNSAPEHPRFPHAHAPRLQVRAELRGVLTGEDRLAHRQEQAGTMREGTLSVAGSPQPFKPVSEEPSIITRMPHMINQQFRGQMMYGGATSGSGYVGGRGPSAQQMYRQYPPQYYSHLRHLPPYTSHMPPGSMHGPPGSPHGPPGLHHGPPGSPHGPPALHHGPPGSTHGLPHPPPGMIHRPPVSSASQGLSARTPAPPGLAYGPPGASHLPPGPAGQHHGPPGSMRGPLGPPHGPHNSPHGPHGVSGMPRVPHAPPGTSNASPRLAHAPGTIPRPAGPPHGPPGSPYGPSGPPGPPHGQSGPPQGSSGPPHGPPRPSLGPSGSPLGHPGPSHGSSRPSPGPQHGPPGPPHGPPGPPHGPPGPPNGHPHGPSGPPHGPPGSMGLSHGQQGPPELLRGPSGPPHGSSGPPHGPSGPLHGLSGLQHRPPGPQHRLHGPAGSPHGQSGLLGPLHGPSASPNGQSELQHRPPGTPHGPPGSIVGPSVSPNSSSGTQHGEPGQSNEQSGPQHGPPHGAPRSPHGSPGPQHGSTGPPQGPSNLTHRPSGPQHGSPGLSHGPHGSPYGPPGPPHGPLGPPHGPPGPPHGPPGPPHGPPGPPHGPPGPPHGPPGPPHGPHGPPHGLHGPPHGPPGLPHGSAGPPYGPSGSLHGPLGSLHGRLGPPRGSPHDLSGSVHRPLGSILASSSSLHALQGMQRPPPGLPRGPPGGPYGPPDGRSPPASPPGPAAVKTEVKREPSPESPRASPPPPPPEPPRHPKIKLTDNKERRPRFPLGPYAPHYAAFGAYASPLHRMHQLHQLLPGAPPHLHPHPPPPPAQSPPRAAPSPSPPAAPRSPPPEPPASPPAASPPRSLCPPSAPSPPPPPVVVKKEMPAEGAEGEGEGGGVFGGLVSYFSSQREDDLDE